MQQTYLLHVRCDWNSSVLLDCRRRVDVGRTPRRLQRRCLHCRSM